MQAAVRKLTRTPVQKQKTASLVSRCYDELFNTFSLWPVVQVTKSEECFFYSLVDSALRSVSKLATYTYVLVRIAIHTGAIFSLSSSSFLLLLLLLLPPFLIQSQRYDLFMEYVPPQPELVRSYSTPLLARPWYEYSSTKQLSYSKKSKLSCIEGKNIRREKNEGKNSPLSLCVQHRTRVAITSLL